MAATVFYNQSGEFAGTLQGSQINLIQFMLWWEGSSLTIPRGKFILLTPDGGIITANAHKLAQIISSPSPLT